VQDSVVFAWNRDVDLRSAPDARAEVDAAAVPGLQRLTIDLTHVGFVDSIGLGVLIHARNRCHDVGASLVVRGMPDRTRAMVDASGLADLFTYEG
jgi:anti-anti-sigma factor